MRVRIVLDVRCPVRLRSPDLVPFATAKTLSVVVGFLGRTTTPVYKENEQGFLQPRRFGLAFHLGLILDKPTIGCAKSRLWGRYEEPDLEQGAYTYLTDKDEVIGAAVRTRTNVRVVYVSIGHRISLDSARTWTLGCCQGYRLPETTRHAHNTKHTQHLSLIHI